MGPRNPSANLADQTPATPADPLLTCRDIVGTFRDGTLDLLGEAEGATIGERRDRLVASARIVPRPRRSGDARRQNS